MKRKLTLFGYWFAGLFLGFSVLVVVIAGIAGDSEEDTVQGVPGSGQAASSQATPLSSQVLLPVREVVESYEPVCGPFPDDPRWEAEQYGVDMHPYKDFLYPYVSCLPVDGLKIDVFPARDSTHLGRLTLFIDLDRIDNRVIVDEVAVTFVGMLANTVQIQERTTLDKIGTGLYQQVYDPQFTEGSVCTQMRNGQPVSTWCPGQNIAVEGQSSLGVKWSTIRVDDVASVWFRVQQ